MCKTFSSLSRTTRCVSTKFKLCIIWILMSIIFSDWWRGHRNWIPWTVWKPSADNKYEGVEKERMRIMTCIDWQRYLTISATILKQHFYCSAMKFQVKMLQLLKWRIWTDFNILSLKSKYLINICFKLQQDTKVVLSNDIAKSVWRFLWSDSDIISFSPGRQRALPFELRPRVTQGSRLNPDWGLESLCPDDYLFSDVFLKSTSDYSIQTDWKNTHLSSDFVL